MSEFDPEQLRPIISMAEPDPRWESHVVMSSEGEFKPITLEQYAAPIQAIKLNDSVPESVTTHFETARNLALYAWNVYRFISVAQLYAYTSIEFALREKMGDERRPFKKLFEQAIKSGWFKNEYFPHWQRLTKEKADQFKLDVARANALNLSPPKKPEVIDHVGFLPEFIIHFRNNYAHGSSTLIPHHVDALEDSAAIINQIY
jgi:hypothetical protein